MASGLAPTTIGRWARWTRHRLGLWRGRISIITVSPATSRRLNERYRRRPRPTNVLSFRYASTHQPAADEQGEIILCPAVIRDEAKVLGQPYAQRLKFLLQHGCIHLLGLDHQTPAAVRRWSRYERRLQRP